MPPIAACCSSSSRWRRTSPSRCCRPRMTNSPYFGPTIIICDTLWITAALLISGKFNAEFFFLYFFILLLAAIGETLWLIALAAVAVCGAYLYVLSAIGGGWSMWDVPLADPHSVPVHGRGVLRLPRRPHPPGAPPRARSRSHQVGVPRQHLARAAHAAHRHPRLRRPPARGRVRAAAVRATAGARQGAGGRREPPSLSDAACWT